MTGQPDRMRELFLAALKVPSDQRQAYLREACAEDRELEAQVESLIAAHYELGSVDRPAGLEPTQTFDFPVEFIHAGDVFAGRYKLLEQIGEGGMGTVWMAEQIEPVQRRVAVKLIKTGLDSRLVVARFDAERQALALMDHPNIAKVLDGGMTPPTHVGGSPLPYFVMELVKGTPITKFCDEKKFSVRQRLELFADVCRAVQHAHQKGIIHRDIKPSNALVALYDGRPVVKVIDFGVAKATGQKLTELTLFTGFGAVVGTPEYMSPEQAEVNNQDVDTRSDIYSLGVLLYELLTGSTPLTRKRVQEAALMEVLRVIREEEPPKPSTRLSSTDELPSISAQRQSEPAKLTRLVRGELDWIVMKALEKDRNRRYETANGFAMDVQRYLADEVVEARPPSAMYRYCKFARRYRRGLTAGFAFMLLLVVAVVALSIALVKVSQERRDKEAALQAEAKRRSQTRAALDAMTSEIIENWLARQTVLLPEHKRFLEKALLSYEEFAADTGQNEESRAGVAHAYGRVAYIRNQLGQLQESEAAWLRCRDLYSALSADFPAVVDYRQKQAKVDIMLCILYRQTRRVDLAEVFINRALNIYRQLRSEMPEDPDHRFGEAASLDHLGVVLKNSRRPQEAEAIYYQALAILGALAKEFPNDADYLRHLAQTHHNLGVLLDSNTGRSSTAVSKNPGRPQEALEQFAKAVAIFKQLSDSNRLTPEYRDAQARSLDSQASVLRDQDHRDAESVFRQVLSIRRQLAADYYAVPHFRQGLAISLNNLAILLKKKDELREAEMYYNQSLDIHRQLANDFPEVTDHQNNVAGAMGNLGRLHLDRKDFEGARRLYEGALPYHQAALKSNDRHPLHRNFFRLNRWRLAETYLGLKDHAAAAASAQEFFNIAFEPGRDSYTAATLFAGCVRLALQDERLTEMRRTELATTYGDRAMAAIGQAVAKDAEELTLMTKDPSLDSLRNRKDFQKLLADWEARKKP